MSSLYQAELTLHYRTKDGIDISDLIRGKIIAIGEILSLESMLKNTEKEKKGA